tara:strand:- start:1738 stop:2775 length:1038 start_codon:yes stop_codon:yes gene_type:complete
MVNNSISCIVITNGLNNKFLTERTLSSIIRTTTHIKWDVELIVVDNSPGQNVKDIVTQEGYAPVESKRIKIINSLPNHLPKAFNAGVKTATKKYIALFHDDCEILDNKWVEKLTSELNDTVYMVGPELHTNITPHKIITQKSYLKEVPVVLERENFLSIGGYDETYYWGFEDVMMSTKIVNNGKSIKQIAVKYLHFDGMSTILLQRKNNPEVDKGKFIETQNTFVGMKGKEEFNTYQEENIGKIEVKIKDVAPNKAMYTLLVAMHKSFKMKMRKNIGINLGYLQAFKYWKTADIPTEVLVGLMPKTKNDIEVLMKDIRENKDGELYSGLEKYKGEIFKRYFETTL